MNLDEWNAQVEARVVELRQRAELREAAKAFVARVADAAKVAGTELLLPVAKEVALGLIKGELAELAGR